jgi:hypothetical protein
LSSSLSAGSRSRAFALGSSAIRTCKLVVATCKRFLGLFSQGLSFETCLAHRPISAHQTCPVGGPDIPIMGRAAR